MKNKLLKNCLRLVLGFALLLTIVLGNNNVNISQTVNTNNVSFNVNGKVTEDVTPPVTPVPPTELGAAVANDDSNMGISDVYLYTYLLKEYNDYYGLTGTENEQKQIYVEMFSQMTELDLSGNGVITSVKGLKVLNLENIEVLKLSHNLISSISADDITQMPKLEELDLSDNNLTSLTLPTSLVNLKKLNLNKNYLTKMDISLINIGEVYLSMNKIEKIADVTFPRMVYNTNLYVELFNNNILDADQVYANGIVADAKIKVELGLQGYGLNYKEYDSNEDKITPVFNKAHGLKFYNSVKYPNLKAIIYKRYSDNEIQKEITNNSTTNITTYTLPVGDYRMEYVNSLDNTTMYNQADSVLLGFKGHDGFRVVPTTPTVNFVVKGKEVEDRDKFSGAGLLRATNTNGEGDIYYSFDGETWTKGNEVKLDKGGQYSVSFKVVIGELGSQDSYESEVVYKSVSQSVNPYIPDSIMLIVIIGITLLFVFVVVPLIAKYTLK